MTNFVTMVYAWMLGMFQNTFLKDELKKKKSLLHIACTKNEPKTLAGNISPASCLNQNYFANKNKIAPHHSLYNKNKQYKIKLAVIPSIFLKENKKSKNVIHRSLKKKEEDI